MQIKSKKLKMNIKKSSTTVLFFIVLTNALFAQTTITSELRAEQARQKLEERGVSEDDVKKKLKEKGIDLDNVRPEQIATLEDEIKAVVAELEGQKPKSDTAALVDKKTSLESVSDSVRQKQLDEISTVEADEINQRLKDGATYEEAIAESLSEQLSKKYRAKTGIWGHHIFYDRSLELFRTTKSVTVPDGYVLDVGDKVAINIFGPSQADLLYEIEEDGFIRPSGIAKIYLKGVPLGKAKQLIRSRLKQSFLFTDGQMNVELHTARTVTVNIFGEVNQPGSYTISALNTALHAIIAAGGLNSQASVRNIKVYSSGKERIMDIYDFLNNPGYIEEFYLSNNDMIFIPKWEKLISAAGGGFRNGYQFELLPNENFNKLVEYAALHPQVNKNWVQHLTYDEDQRIIKDFDFEYCSKNDLKLKHLDAISMRITSVELENYIQINGAVRYPGQYEFKEGDKLSSAINKAFIEERTFSDIAYLRRTNIDGTYQLKRIYVQKILDNVESIENFELQKRDVLSFYAKSSFVDRFNFSIRGAVRDTNTYFYDPQDNITLYDALMMSKGLLPNATDFGYIIGQPITNSQERTYKVVNLRAALENPNSERNTIIKPNDIIVVPSIQSYTDQFFVNISGAVRNPGRYVYNPSLTLREMLVMAGGLRLEAASNKVDVFRLVLDENEPTRTESKAITLNRDLEPYSPNDQIVLRPFDHVVVRNIPEFEPIQYVNINGEVRYPGLYAIMYDNEPISSLVKRAGGLSKEAFPEAASFFRSEDNIGFVVTRIDKAINGRKRHDILIRGGDAITIPKFIDVVKISRFGTNASEIYMASTLGGEDTSGNTLNIVVNFKKKNANWYVRKFAGGFDRSVAAKGKTKVKHLNGEVKGTVNLGIVKFYPKVRRGSEIVIVAKKRYTRLRKKEEKENQMIEKGIAPKEKEKISLTERMMQMQAFAAVASAITTTTVSTILIIQELKK